MALFRVDPDDPFEGPHQGQKMKESGSSAEEAEIGAVLVHGRGDSAEGILSLAKAIDMNAVCYRAPQASGNSWYPYSFLRNTEENEPGISSGLQAVHDAAYTLRKDGFSSREIVIMGFSQGACLSLEFVARHPVRYGAVIGFSGGLIGPEIDPELYSGDMQGTPVFLGCSDRDPHIPVDRVHQTAEIFKDLNAQVEKQIYPNMPHTINEDEIAKARSLFHNIRNASD